MFKSIIFLRIMLDSSISTQDHEQVWVRHQIVSKHHVVTLTKVIGFQNVSKCHTITHKRSLDSKVFQIITLSYFQKAIECQIASNCHTIMLTEGHYIPKCTSNVTLSHSQKVIGFQIAITLSHSNKLIGFPNCSKHSTIIITKTY
jgi:hypothetical protein